MAKYLTALLLFVFNSMALCSDNLDLNLLIPADSLVITRGGQVTFNEKKFKSNKFSETNSIMITEIGDNPYSLAEIKSNNNGSLNSIITAVPQAGHYQVLKFDSLGKLLSKATCSDVKDELSCNVIVPSFCHQFMSNSGAKNSEDLRSKVNSCRKLTTSFERSKAYDAKIDMEKALVNSSEALRSSHLNKSNTVLRAVVDQKFKLNYTADVEIGIFDMVEMAEDCARFEDQGVFPPRAAAQVGEKIKVQ